MACRLHSSPPPRATSTPDQPATTTSSGSQHPVDKTTRRGDRIDSILDEARTRRVMMKAEDGAGSRGVRQNIEAETEGRESSADEETSIVNCRSTRPNSGSNTMNYQATTQIARPASLRNRPSTASIRRKGRVHSPGEHVDETEVDEEEGWWARFLSEYGSIELENKGSVARDHLALERTFLAWLRTSLAFASIGIAITQLFRLNTTSAAGNGSDPYSHLRQMGKPLGATFLGISIVMLIVGFHRYFESQHWIIRGKFPASRGSIVLVVAITFALMVTSLAVVLVVEPRAFEKSNTFL